MSADWSWLFLDAHGNPMEGEGLPTTGFPTQSDAESYLGESWRELLDAGVEAVTLREHDAVVYGPMSLRACGASRPAVAARPSRRCRAGSSATCSARVATAQRSWRSPGVSVGVVRDGALVWSTHVGAARLGADAVAGDRRHAVHDRLGDQDVHRAAGHVAARRGTARRSTTRSRRTSRARKHARVPLRQMLAHASACSASRSATSGRAWRRREREEFLAGVEDAEQVLPAHHAFHYSNLAYGLLGQVVERVTGQDWERVVRERVLDPLGMTRTGLTPADDRAVGYQIDPYAGTASEEPLFTLNATAPLGGLWSTVADMARYAAYVARPDDRVVRPETVDEMCRPHHHDRRRRLERRLRPRLRHGPARRPGLRRPRRRDAGLPHRACGCRRKEGIGAIVFANATSGALTLALATDLVEAVVDAEPSLASAWVPEPEQPGLTELLGLWWSEGSPITFFVRDGAAVVAARRRRAAVRDAVCRRGHRPLPGGRGPRARRGARGRARGRRLGRQALLRDVCRHAGAARVRRPARG